MSQTSFVQNRLALAAQTYGRVYRLALLATGDIAHARDATLHAFSTLASSEREPEQALAQSVLAFAERRQRRAASSWQPATADNERAEIASTTAKQLVAALWAALPAARLLFGLHTLWGFTLSEITATIDHPIELVHDLRASLAIAKGNVPADADRAELVAIAGLLAGTLAPDEASTVRARLLSDPTARALRDGLIAAEQELRRIIPALFAASPPSGLLEEIEAILLGPVAAEQHTHERARGFSPKAKLTAIVLLIIAAVLVAPLFWQIRSPVGQSARLSVASEPSALIYAAIHRLDQPTQQTGVLHEVYRGTLGNQVWTQERWYEFAAPNRLSVKLIRGDDETPIYTLVSDGTGKVDYFQRSDRDRRGRLRGLTVTLSPNELQTALPILRQQPDRTFFEVGTPPDLGRFYLAQARAADLSSLGSTTFHGRSARLVAYTTDQALAQGGRGSGVAGQVVLTIDDATASLLDVTVLPAGNGVDAALHPWRAEVFELRNDAPETAFAVPQSPTRQQPTLPNPRAPFMFGGNIVSLDALIGTTQEVMYLPQSLPEPMMRGLVVERNAGEQPMVLYEGEFRSIILASADAGLSQPTLSDTLQQAGSFDYRLGSSSMSSTTPISVALVSDRASARQIAEVYLLDQYATPAERAAALEQIVTSLEALTSDTIETLGRPFYRPEAAGGTGQ